MKNSQKTEMIFEEVREGILQQGIIIKALIDIMLEKELMTRYEFDKKIIEINKEVQDEIKKLEKEMDGLDEKSNIFYGKGGDA